MRSTTLTAALAATIAVASAADCRNPYDIVSVLQSSSQNDPLTVDLGYALYEGHAAAPNSSVNVWKGIRYAAPPVGSLRFQAPRVPEIDRQKPQQASADPPSCLQSGGAGTNSSEGAQTSDDCLFLNVFAPKDARDLPVFVWIHGGGYQGGEASQFDPSALMNTSSKGFVSVIIQYRLGAFGFLSSEEVKERGALNAGLQDQQLTFQWVQKYIHLFGGDPSRVTIAGESAGAGSVMNHAIAYGGNQDCTPWENGITASPFLPQTFEYNAPEVLANYKQFAMAAGCTMLDTFECLQKAPLDKLIEGNNAVAKAALSGIFAWKPVVDGLLVPQRPSVALKGKVNGKRILTGNNANEGFFFTPQNITTQAQFTDYLKRYFPRLSTHQVDLILGVYATPDTPDNPALPKFATGGNGSLAQQQTPGLAVPNAVNQSQLSTGHQQVANNLYAEITFVCPSYWLAQAFSFSSTPRTAVARAAAFQYQFSVSPATHGFDVQFYFPPAARAAARNNNPGAATSRAFMEAYAGFVEDGKPGGGWPERMDGGRAAAMLNLNATGGTPVPGGAGGATVFVDPGVLAVQQVVDADAWEAGRGRRCEFLRELGEVLVI